jgi:anti-sigma B factor antagonist
METQDPFHYEVEQSRVDIRGNPVTTIKCHGKLIAGTADKIKEAVKPLLPQGGRIVVDLGDVTFLDSSGLGALVGLKVSALNQGLCILEFANMTPRVLDLLRITKLMDLFSS